MSLTTHRGRWWDASLLFWVNRNSSVQGETLRTRASQGVRIIQRDWQVRGKQRDGSGRQEAGLWKLMRPTRSSSFSFKNTPGLECQKPVHSSIGEVWTFLSHSTSILATQDKRWQCKVWKQGQGQAVGCPLPLHMQLKGFVVTLDWTHHPSVEKALDFPTFHPGAEEWASEKKFRQWEIKLKLLFDPTELV